MKAGIIFCTAVSLALLAVILLATMSPQSQKQQNDKTTKPPPWLALSLYIQQPRTVNSNAQHSTTQPDAGAFIFHRTLTEGPENTSRVVGKAQGFIIPIEHFAHSAFNVIYLSFDSPEYSGSLSVLANHVSHNNREELSIVGGTGSFAFAHGVAVFVQTEQNPSDMDVTYHVKLQLSFPNKSQTIPG